MSEADRYKRYESEELIEWKKLDSNEQLKIVNDFSKEYSEKVEVNKVHDQSIEISLCLNKDDVYKFLVDYETYLRDKLGGFPIIVLLKDRADENRKRK